MHNLCTHLNLFSSKGPHPNRNSEQRLIENHKASRITLPLLLAIPRQRFVAFFSSPD